MSKFQFYLNFAMFLNRLFLPEIQLQNVCTVPCLIGLFIKSIPSCSQNTVKEGVR